jgi:hypothetical protein
LREHLKDLLYPMQQANFRVRFGLVAYAAGRDATGPVYDHTFIGGSGPEMMAKLYGPNPSGEDFFTADPAKVAAVLGGLHAQGNEDTLLALDIAADLPFGPPESTRRVIAVFTDEPLEQGIGEQEPVAMVPQLVQKLMSRRIQIFASAPLSPALEELGSVARSEIEPVEGGDGLQSVDFGKLLAQMGKSISISSLQMGAEPAWSKALFGQDRWAANRFSGADDKSVIIRSGEIGGIRVQCGRLGVLLDVSPSMEPYLQSLRAEIARHFADAKYREEGNCMLSTSPGPRAGGNLRKLKELIGPEGCDGVYWFSDFQDRREPQAVEELRGLLRERGVKLYVRSLQRSPQVMVDLASESGGEFKAGDAASLTAT